MLQLFQRLVAEEVAFVVIGGFAAIAHGVPYITQDIDICYNPDPSNIARLERALLPLHPGLRVHGLTDEEARALPFRLDAHALRQSSIMTLITDVAQLDLMHSVPGVGNYTEVERNSMPLPLLPDSDVLVLDLPALIASKRAAGRPKDLFILPEIEATLRLREGQDSSQA